MSIRDEPHYRIASCELADWLVAQGTDRWWSVDGDPLLTGRLSFPCPADELAAELRRLSRTLLVQDRRQPPLAHGESIGAHDIDCLTTRLTPNLPSNGTEQPWAQDRVLSLCWEDRDQDWLLVEDCETTESSRADAAAVASARK